MGTEDDATPATLRRLYLGRLFPAGMPGRVVISAKYGRLLHHENFAPGDTEAILASIANQEAQGATGFWVGSGTMDPSALSGNKKGGAAAVRAVAALNLDLDGAWGQHSRTNLPATPEEAMSPIADLDPTMVMQTGGGLSALWLPPQGEWWETGDETTRAATQTLARDLWARANSRYAARGWHLDNTSNIDRLLRIAGTYNHKTGEPILVTRSEVAPGRRSGSVWQFAALRQAIRPVTKLVAPSRPEYTRPVDAPPSPIEHYTRTHDLDAELVAAGFQFLREESTGKRVYKHPTATNEQSGDTVSSPRGRVAYFFSTGGVAPEQVTFDVYALLEHQVGRTRAMDAAKDERDRTYGLGAYAPLPTTIALDGQPATLVADPGTYAPPGRAVAPVTLPGVKPGFTASIMGLDAFLTLPEPEWLVEQMLEVGIAYLTGASNTGKSFVAVDMAAHLALGRDWHGYRIPKSIRVLYVAAEAPSSIVMRVKAWIGQYGVDDVDRLRANLGFSAYAPQVSDADDAAQLVAAADHYDLVILDTQTDITAGLDENSKRDMDMLLMVMRAIYNKGKSVMSIHHPNLADGAWRPRGIGTQTGKADTILTVKPDDKNKRLITVKPMKLKNASKNRGVKLLLPADGDPAVLTDAGSQPTLRSGEERSTLIIRAICELELSDASRKPLRDRKTDIGNKAGVGEIGIREIDRIHELMAERRAAGLALWDPNAIPDPDED